jgi:hypothetical protein
MSFICNECGSTFPNGKLSSQSLAIAGTRTKTQALATLDEYDQVCTRCQNLIEGSIEEAPPAPPRLTSLQSWYYSGLTLSPVQVDWLNLNY